MTALSTRTLGKLPRHASWIQDAPCAQGPDSVYDHDLPPEHRGTRKTRAALLIDMQVLAALRNCARCPFTRECLDRVQPARDFHDGVCGGFVFLNGEVIGGLTTRMDGVA